MPEEAFKIAYALLPTLQYPKEAESQISLVQAFTAPNSQMVENTIKVVQAAAHLKRAIHSLRAATETHKGVKAEAAMLGQVIWHMALVQLPGPDVNAQDEEKMRAVLTPMLVMIGGWISTSLFA